MPAKEIALTAPRNKWTHFPLIYEDILDINGVTGYSSFSKDFIINFFSSQMLVVSNTHTHTHVYLCVCVYIYIHIYDWFSSDFRFLRKESLNISFNNEYMLNLCFWAITILVMQTLGINNPEYFLYHFETDSCCLWICPPGSVMKNFP